MQVLDLNIPKYISSLISDNKAPSSIKTVRGKGILETRSNYSFEEKIILNFDVDEKNLKKLLKLQARFQTLIILPWFDLEVSLKLLDGYNDYKDIVEDNVGENLDSKNYTKKEPYKRLKNTQDFAKSMIEMGYLDVPEQADCFFVFLEGFSVKSISDAYEGYSVEMTLWTCSDLAYMNDNREDFIIQFYKNFEKKRKIFETIDEKIESIFSNKKDGFNIKFRNVYNEQDTYTEGKSFSKEETPYDISVDGRHITDVEVRAYNNLKRIPIQNKPKGFIQHLGKGETAVSLRMVLNEKNARETELIHKLKAVTLSEQKYIVSSESELFLTKAFDLKELDLINISITEATDELDATIVNLLFIASGTNKIEANSDYLNPLSRQSTTVFLKCFENMLDKAMASYDEFKNLLIQSSDRTNDSKGPEMNNNYNLINLVDAYYDENLKKIIYAEKASRRGVDNNNLTFNDSELPLFDFLGENRVRRDIYGIDAVMYRFNQFSYYFLKNLVEVKNEDGTVTYKIDREAIDIAVKKDMETKQSFIDDVYEYFLAYQFNMKFDMTSMDLTMVNYMFELEIINELLTIISEMILSSYEDEDLKGLFYGNRAVNVDLLEDGKFNEKLRLLISKMVTKMFKMSRKILTGEEFKHKTTMFYAINLYDGDVLDSNLPAIEKSVEGATKKILERFDKIYNPSSGTIDDNYVSIIVSAFKLCCVGFYEERTYITGQAPIRENNEFSIELQSYLISYCISSIFIPNLAFEKADLGMLIKESSQSIVAPISLSAISLEQERNRILSEKFVDEKGNEVFDEERLEKIDEIIKHINSLFGEGAYEELLNFSSAYKRVNSKNADFQSIYGITVFTEYETPLDFLKNIIENTKVSKVITDHMDKALKMADIKESEYDSAGNEIINKDTSVKDMIDNIEASSKEILDTTINAKIPGNSMPGSFMNRMLIGQVKFRSAFAELSRIITADYKNILPDFEIVIIDEFKVEQALYESSYRTISDYFNLSNIYHVSIKKNDITNTKNAIIKVANTRAHFIDANTYFKEIGFMNENVGDTVVYNNRFVTERPELRIGMLINISLDKSNPYFDFTGKIDSIDINSNDIVIKCSSFASELFNQVTDVNNFKKDGLLGIFSWNGLKDLVTRSYKTPLEIARSKTNTDPNRHLFPETDFVVNLESEREFNLASVNSVLFSALGDTLGSVNHLNCSYNQLLSNEKTLSKTQQILKTNRMKEAIKDIIIGREIGRYTTNRIAQNINNVDRDLGFYGLSLKDGKYQFNASSFVKIPMREPTTFLELYLGDNKKFSDIYAYQRKNATLYEILNDMTLRSPGSFWEVYESGNFATLFFGRNNYQIKRKNKTSTLTSEEINMIIKYLLDSIVINAEHGPDSYYKFYNQLRAAARIYDNTIDAEDEYIETVDKFTKQAIQQEYEDVSSKVYAVAGYNLISCNIQVNNNCPNTIQFEYDPTLSKRVKNWFKFQSGNSIKLKMYQNIPASQEKVKFISPEEIPCVHTPEQAFEVAQSVMYKELRNYYSGKIIMLYNPNIRVNTEITIMDKRNKINGTVIVRDYEHILDSEMGLITMITPGMKTRTTSLLSDVYLYGLWQRIHYAWIRDSFVKDRITLEEQVGRTTADALKDNLLQAVKQADDVPIVLNNVGYSYNVSEKSVSEETNSLKAEVRGTKNESELPFKIYPIIKSGRPVMPDADFFGDASTPFYWITNIVLMIRYKIFDSVLKEESRAKIWNNLKSLMGSMFNLSDAQSIEQIVELFNAFNGNKIFEDDLMRSDYGELYSRNTIDDTMVKYDRVLAEGNCYGFLNCAKLNITEKDRIRRIAKVMFHFEVVNLVELDGRTVENPSSASDFSFEVVEELRKELEYFSKMYGKKNEKWTIVTKERLIDSDPFRVSDNEWYDDIGAVLVNLPEELASRAFVAQSPLLYSASIGVEGKEKTATRKAIRYNQNSVDSNGVNIYKINSNADGLNGASTATTEICVLHNYYGGSIDSYALRKEMLKDLMGKFFRGEGEKFMFGDYNLRLRTPLNIYTEANNDNENFDVPNQSALIYKGYTTSGNKLYDNIVVDNMRSRGLASVFRYFDSNSDSYFKAGGEFHVSDHFPIFLMNTDELKTAVFKGEKNE